MHDARKMCDYEATLSILDSERGFDEFIGLYAADIAFCSSTWTWGTRNHCEPTLSDSAGLEQASLQYSM